MSEPTYRLRPGRPDDARPLVDVFAAAMRDLTARKGIGWEPDPDDLWRRHGPMLELIGRMAAAWWVAEDRSSGELIGYARSIERGGLFELSEFFVHPERQAAGVGAALLERAFPAGRGDVRVIIATPSSAAQARYYRAGTAARFPIVAIEGAPRVVEGDGGVEVRRLQRDAPIDELRRLEAAILEFDRGEEFRWLLEQREGYLYLRDGAPIGFAFVGQTSGPIAALDAADQVAILCHVESRSAELEVPTLSLEVPMVNEVAVRHLLARGFRLDSFYTFLMSSRPFGRFDRFIGFAPPFVL